LLAQWGHGVVLITRPPTPSPSLAESIPPSTAKLFDLLGIRETMEGAGFIRSTGNTVWWGDEAARVEPFAGGALGWQVTADRLEPLLQKLARDAGVHLEYGRVTFAEAITRDAAFVLDCTGRAGVVSRSRGWRVFEPAYRTVALVGLWRAPTGFDIPDQTHTLIESYVNGWAWSVPRSGVGPQAAGPDCDRYVAVMVDPRSSDLAQDRTARDVYTAEIRKTRRIAGLVREAELVIGPSGWDASMYSSTRYADDRLLLVGDAGSFIDPLASIGVKKALASGWLAAVATHTALMRPSMRAVALDFFSARESEIYTGFRRLTAQYLAAAATAHRHPFWADRTEGDEIDADTLAVRAAFDRIRSADAIRLQRGPGLRVEGRPAVAGCEIVMESRIVSEAVPAGVRYLFDVDVLALIDLAPAHSQVPDLFAAYNRRHAPVSLPDFLTALATAVALGYLKNASPDA
jgi:2-polyprenyl-6-methoxyphenol hydroxylase-like FAD-dependent oxidoreductase